MELQLWWTSVSAVVPARLQTAEKRARMTPANIADYNAATTRALLDGDSLFRLIDMHHLTASCGAKCTTDGIHYVDATYAAAVQVLLSSASLHSDRTARDRPSRTTRCELLPRRASRRLSRIPVA